MRMQMFKQVKCWCWRGYPDTNPNCNHNHNPNLNPDTNPDLSHIPKPNPRFEHPHILFLPVPTWNIKLNVNEHATTDRPEVDQKELNEAARGKRK